MCFGLAGAPVSARLLMRVALIAGLGIALFAVWWLYELGKLRGVEELGALRTEHAMLETRHERLLDEAAALRDRVAILDRSSQIDRQAALDIKDDLGQLEENLQAAREEIEFYRGIVAPGDVQSGLRIHRFALEEGVAAAEYHYDLVLTQLKRNDRYVTGTVDWSISGIMVGEQGELALAGVTNPPVKQLKFRFRYFQELAGKITLPDGFEPQKVVLSIQPKGKGKLPAIEQTFDWPQPDLH
jgi:hypothetical protein